MQVVTTKDNEGNKGKITDATKMTIYCRNYKCVCKVCGSCVWSRMGFGDSWYDRVVVVHSWTFDKGSWHRSSHGDTARCLMRVSWDRSGCWMQLDDRCRKLRLVETLNVAGRSLQAAEVGWSRHCQFSC